MNPTFKLLIANFRRPFGFFSRSHLVVLTLKDKIPHEKFPKARIERVSLPNAERLNVFEQL